MNGWKILNEPLNHSGIHQDNSLSHTQYYLEHLYGGGAQRQRIYDVSGIASRRIGRMATIYCIPFFTAVICVGLRLILAATNELVPPNLPTGCACPGDSLTYTCTVVDGSVTFWSGTAFDCIGNQNLVLLHIQFGTDTVTAVCGSLSATGDSATATSGQVCYSSTLTVPVSVSLNGLTVGCDHVEPGVNVSGSPHTLSVAGMLNND